MVKKHIGCGEPNDIGLCLHCPYDKNKKRCKIYRSASPNKEPLIYGLKIKYKNQVKEYLEQKGV